MVPGIILFALLRLPNVCECLGRLTVTLTQSDKGRVCQLSTAWEQPFESEPFFRVARHYMAR